jgi:hypothetical protein
MSHQLESSTGRIELSTAAQYIKDWLYKNTELTDTQNQRLESIANQYPDAANRIFAASTTDNETTNTIATFIRTYVRLGENEILDNLADMLSSAEPPQQPQTTAPARETDQSTKISQTETQPNPAVEKKSFVARLPGWVKKILLPSLLVTGAVGAVAVKTLSTDTPNTKDKTETDSSKDSNKLYQNRSANDAGAYQITEQDLEGGDGNPELVNKLSQFVSEMSANGTVSNMRVGSMPRNNTPGTWSADIDGYAASGTFRLDPNGSISEVTDDENAAINTTNETTNPNDAASSESNQNTESVAEYIDMLSNCGASQVFYYQNGRRVGQTYNVESITKNTDGTITILYMNSLDGSRFSALSKKIGKFRNKKTGEVVDGIINFPDLKPTSSGFSAVSMQNEYNRFLDEHVPIQ